MTTKQDAYNAWFQKGKEEGIKEYKAIIKQKMLNEYHILFYKWLQKEVGL